MLSCRKFPAAFSILALVLFLAACSHPNEIVDGQPSDTPAVLILDGLASAIGVAVSPLGPPYVSEANGQIHHVLTQGGSIVFAETGASPAGLAFDGSGDLLVTDTQKQAVLKITPWSEVGVLAEGLSSPQGVAVSPHGEVFVVDSAASTLYRCEPDGQLTVLRNDLPSPRGVTASSDGRHLFVSGGEGEIWKITLDGKERTEFAFFAGAGKPAGMALDEEGNLYVARDGGGQVSVLNAEGSLIETYVLPAPRVTGVAFGGDDLKSLLVCETSTGSIYKIEVGIRSQRLSWEPDLPLRFTGPVDGDILNRHDGETSSEGLLIPVRGTFRGEGPVRINGVEVAVTDGRFETTVLLEERENLIAAEARDGLRHEITVWWDRDSFPRYRISTDDNILFLKDIAENARRYRSIFQNPYLAFWRDMNRKYGSKINHNIYYETDGFNLSQMPDKFRQEWQQNASWMHLSFHARANEPDRPYLHSSAERIRNDYRLILGEIERFAGKQVVSDVTTIHWGEATLAAARAVRDEGINTYVGYFRGRDGIPSVCYYLPLAQWQHLMSRDYWKDTEEDLFYVRHDIIINTHKMEDIVPYLESIVADPHQAEVMELMIHEQYFYPGYRAYQPDFKEKVETAIKFVVDRGYKPVFFADGFLGAPVNE